MSSSNRVSSRISSFSSLEVAWIALSMALAIDLTESSIEHLVTDSAWCFDSNSRVIVRIVGLRGDSIMTVTSTFCLLRS